MVSFDSELDQARNSLNLEEKIKHLQRAFTVIEICRWPVLVGVQGACVGAGIDLISACDIVYGSKDSFYAIKEVDIGIAADLGSLQRLPIMASNWMKLKQFALTGERFGPAEALEFGLLGKICDDKKSLEGSEYVILRGDNEDCCHHI